MRLTIIFPIIRFVFVFVFLFLSLRFCLSVFVFACVVFCLCCVLFVCMLKSYLMRRAIVSPIIRFVFVFLSLLVLCCNCVFVEMLPDEGGDSIPHHVVSTAHRRTELARRSQKANRWMHKCTSAQMHMCKSAHVQICSSAHL